MKRYLWSLASLFMLFAPAADAQTDGGTEAPDAGSRIDELERRVEILSQQLEAQQLGTASATVPAPVPTEVPTATAPAGMAPAAGKVYGTQGGLSIGGYGETYLSVFADDLQDGTRAPIDNITDTLRAVIYVGYKFTDWLVFDSEVEFEHSGFSDEHPEGEAIVEFAYLDFLLHKSLNLRVGQVLLPVGFINQLHEPPIFLGALRPQLEQEGGIIPTTWHENGIGIHGDLPAQLSYQLYVINGLNAEGFNDEGTGSIGGGRQDGHQAIANKPAFTGRLDWTPLPGALLGGSFYVGNSAQIPGATAIWTTLLEAHAEYRAHGFQARALYAHLTNSSDGVAALGAIDAAGVGTEQYGGYVEAGYDVLAPLQQSKLSLIPFVRYERLNTQKGVAPVANADPANNRSVVALGANFKPIPQVAIKADYDINTNHATTGRNQFNVAIGYLF